MKKNVLILGSGGREHAFAWAFSNDSNVDKIYCAPGNGGTSKIAENISVNLSNHQEVLRIVNDKNIGMTSKHMGKRFLEAMNTAFKNWKPRERYTMEVV